MKKVFFLILAVIIVILVFSLGSFGVEAEAVLSGYENTRKYANDSKMLTVAVDTYKAEVEKKVEDEKKLKETEPVSYGELSAYGTIDEHSKYEAYTDGLFISNDPTLYLKAEMFQEGSYGGDVYPTDDKKSAAARFDSTINYLTKNNAACGGVESNEYVLYWARQCAALGAWYVNQVSYKDYLDVANWDYMAGECNVTAMEYLEGMGTCWVADTPINYYQNADALKEFFTNVTPGTMVNSHYNEEVRHSYIILGANDERVIIYDCNQDYNCGIKLHDWTWEDMSNSEYYTQAIQFVLAPPNTMLPFGCTRVTDQMGKIL